MTLSHIVIWANGMVMTFDDAGKQMPEFQGPIAEVLSKVLATTEDLNVRFEIGSWRHGTVSCSREELCQLKELLV